jgi:hypothetical protein
MAIKIRADLSAALTQVELDTNFTEYFYSSSVSADQKNLFLHYTGSSQLGIAHTRKHTIPLNPYTGSVSQVVGNTGEIQIKGSSGFSSDSDFKWDTSNNALIINAASVHSGDGIVVQNANLRLKSNASPNTNSKLVLHGNGANKSGSIAYNTGGNESIVFRNETTTSTAGKNNVEFYFRRISSANPAVAFYGNDYSITLGYADKSVANVNISGSLSIQGSQNDVTRMGKLFSFSSLARIDNNSGTNILPGNSRGLILEGPHTGHVVIGIHDNTANEGFAIISSPPTGSSHEPTYNNLVAFFAGNGNVGIGTKAPSQNLHVEGNMLVTGNTVLGNTTSDSTLITGSLGVTGSFAVNGNATVGGTVTLSTLANATSNNYNYVVRETSGALAKQVVAAPIPLGGIIMWSGNMNAIPSGFTLCNGNSGNTVNGVTIPDLTDRFIVGASNTNANAAPTTTVSGSATATGGSTTHNHGGNTGAHTLTTSQIPAHGHAYKDGYFCEINNPGLGNGGAKDFVDDLGASHFKGSGKSDTDNRFIYGRNMTTSDTGGGGSHTHTIATQTNVPPFFALAFIIFTG